jgi:predicted porin
MKKKLLASAIASVLVVGVGAEAADFKASGQVSRVLVVPDDAAGDQLQFLDNNISGSRFRFTGSEDIGQGMKAGFRLEAQLQSNKGNTVNGGTFTDSTGGNLGNQDNIDLRYQDVYVSGNFGKVSLGKGDGASNGRTETDLSGTYIIAGVNHADLYGGFAVKQNLGTDDNGNPTITNERVGSFYGEIDGYSRVNRLRYDSNNYNGFSFAGSYGQREVAELAASFAGGTDTKYEVQAFIGSLGENADSADNGDVRKGFSGSVLLSNGLNFTAAWSEKDLDASAVGDQENMWGKVGYKMGKHAFTVDYGVTTLSASASASDKDTDTMGVSYLFAPTKGVELFAGYREYSVDLDGYTDAEFITVGSRVKF